MPRTRSLLTLEEARAEDRLADNLRAVNDMTLAPFPFTSQRNAIERLGFGLWTHAWAFQGSTSPIEPHWGGLEMYAFGSPLYRQKGMRPGDHSVGIAIDNYGSKFFASSASSLDVTAGDDVAFLIALPERGAFGAATYLIIKSGAAQYYLNANETSFLTWTISDGVDTLDRSLAIGAIPAPLNTPLVIGCGLERGTNKSWLGVCAIGGAPVVTAEGDASAVGTLSNAAQFHFGHGNQATPMYLSHAMACYGPNSASGVSANRSTILQRYADAVASTPAIVSTFAGRGRSFVAFNGHAFEGADVNAGETLLTRDCTVQALVKCDVQAQATASRWSLAGGPGLWSGYQRSVETADGDLVLEFEIGQLGSFAQLGFRRNSDATEGLGGFNYFWYISQNSANQLVVWEGGNGVFATGANFYKVGDRLRVAREANVFKYYYQARGSSVWQLLYTGATDANTMVVSGDSLNGIIVGTKTFDDIQLTVGGVRKPISWRYLNETTAQVFNTGTLYSRGKGEIELAERTSAAVEVRTVNAALGLAELGWVWQDTDGVLRRQAGGTFVVPDGYTLLTATRRWESPTKVILRHFIGAELISEVESADGSIDGSTAGSTVIGSRQHGGDPHTVKAIESILGFGCSFANGRGFLFNEAASPIVDVLNPASTAAAVSTPSFRNPGPNRALGPDFAVGFDSVNDAFDAGAFNDVGAGDDLIIVGVIQPLSLATPSDVFDKGYAGGGGAPGYLLALETGTLGVYVSDAVDVVRVEIPALQLGKFYGFVYVMSRAVNLAAIAGGVIGDRWAFSSTPLSTAAVGSLSNGTNLRIGDTGIYGIGAGGYRLSSLFYTKGAGAAGTLLSSNGGLFNIDVAARAWMDACHARYVDCFDGEIDELRVCDYEMSREEIEATWLRISKYQLDGYRQMRDEMPPGIPISDDPSSRVQRDLNAMGQAMGFGSAQIENVRANIMPDRSYGEVQERWQRITEQPPRSPLDSLDKRRRRVNAHLGKTNGVSVPGVQESEADVLDTDSAVIDVIAFDNTIADGWSTIERERWLPYSPNVTEGTGSLITKTGGVNGAWDAGASASTRLVGDGVVMVTCQLPAANERRIFGVDDALAPLHSNLIKWAWEFGRTGNTSVDVAEAGAFPFSTTYAINDVFAIRRRGTTIEYLKNGTVVYTSLVAAVLPLVVDTGIFHTAAFVWQIRAFKNYASEIELVFDSRTNAAQAYSNITPHGSRLMKTAGVGGNFDAGAWSNESIAGDGYMEYVVNEITTDRTCGLTLSGVPVAANIHQTIEWQWYLSGGPEAQVRSKTATLLNDGAYVAGDVFRVERRAGVVFFYKNGTLKFTSPDASIGPLYVVSGLSTTAPAATMDNVRLYDNGVRIPITWTGIVNARVDGDSLRIQSVANTFTFDNETYDRVSVQMPAELPQRFGTGSNPFNGLQIFSALDPVLLPTNGEAGFFFWDSSGRHLMLFGLRYTGAAYQVGYQRYRNDGTPGDATWQVLATTSLTKHWLRMRFFTGSFAGNSQEQAYDFSWSTTGNQESQLSTSGSVIWRRFVGWWGIYMRGALGGSIDVRFTESQFRNSLGTRPFYWYGIRDPALPGTPDFIGGNAVAKKLKHAFTHAAIIARKSFLCDDPLSVCDVGPVGGI